MLLVVAMLGVDMDEDAAIEAGWQFLCCEQGDVPFAAVVAIVQARCSRVAVERIRQDIQDQRIPPPRYTTVVALCRRRSPIPLWNSF